MKKIIVCFVVIFSILCTITLTSCNNVSKDAPTYIGMSIVKDEKNASLASLLRSSFIFNDKGNGNNNDVPPGHNNGNGNWPGHNPDEEEWPGNHYGWGNQDDYLPEEYDDGNPPVNNIEDTIKIDVILDDQVKYFINQNEEFILQVKLDNPHNYEIQSFTLNGNKYSSYMFEYGSDMENLYLKVIAPKNPGYTEYSIDAIKYIDGTNIKDVDLSTGERTIKAGVKYTNIPTAILSNVNIGTQTFSAKINISDQDGIAHNINFYITNGADIIYTKELILGDNSVSIDNLLMNYNYQYGVFATFDLLDGEYEKSDCLINDVFTTLNAYEFKNVSASQTGVSFDFTTVDSNAALSYLAIFDGDTNTLVKKYDNLMLREISELLSDHNYILYAEYSYKANNKGYVNYIYEDFKTNAKNEPLVDFSLKEVSQDSISFNYDITDKDDICNIEKIELYLGDELIKTITNSSIKNFNNLLSNTEYTIKLTYSYDLNDGKGKVEKSLIQTAKTESKEEPEIDFVRNSQKLNGDSSMIYTFIDNSFYNLESYGDSRDKCVILGGHYNNLPIQYIGWNAFKFCYWVEEAIILDTVTYLGNEVFYGTELKTVIFEGNVPPRFDVNVFGYRSPDVYVPDDAYETYKNIDNNLWQKDIIDNNKLHKFSELNVSFDEFFNGNFDSKITCESIEISYGIKDIDNVLLSFKTELLLGTKLIKSISIDSFVNSKLSFIDLLSNTEYTIKLTYSYDLNDGKGLIEKNVFKNIKTFNYRITFLDENDKLLYECYSDERLPEYPLDLPVKSSDDNYDYSFAIWSIKNETDHEIIYYPTFSKCTKGVQFENNMVIGYTGSFNSVIIPEYWNGYQINTIRSAAFNKVNIKTIDLPNSIEIIGNGAFEDSMLTSITVPEKVKEISNYVFSGCKNLKTVDFSNSVKKIGSGAFRYCNSLKNIVIPEGVTIIDSWAFQQCTSLPKLTLPNSLETINDNAFNGCGSLEINISYNQWRKIEGKANINDEMIVNLFDGDNEEITEIILENDITELENGAFKGCVYLTKIDLSNCVLESIGEYAFYNCQHVKEIVLNEGLERIGNEAFGKCYSLKSIIMPDTVDTIGRAVFADCIHLSNVKLSKGIDTLTDQLFVNCDDLTIVVITEGVTKIESRAFDNCDKLISVIMPSTIQRIEKQAFTYSWNIKNVYCYCTEETWNSIIENYSHDYDNLYLVTAYYYSEEFVEGGWHLVDGVPTKW